jgi:hypothetical protein
MRIFRRKKKINLDTHARIDAAQLKVNSAFIMFQQAHDALDEANVEINEALTESEKKVSSLQAKLENEKLLWQKLLTNIMLMNN